MTAADAKIAPGRSRVILGLSGVGRIWLLNALLGAASGALYVAHLRDLPSAPAPFQLPWFAVAIAFCLSEVLVITVRHRSESQSYSLNEVVLVPALFLLEPGLLPLAVLVGGLFAVVVARRLETIKCAFNVAHWLLEATAATAIFHLVAGSSVDPGTPRSWLAAGLAMTAYAAVCSWAISIAICIATASRWRPGMMVGDRMWLVTGANTALGLLIVVVWWHAAAALWLVVVPLATVALGYRAYLAQCEDQEGLEALNTAIRLFHRAPDLEAGLVAVLDHVRSVFQAARAEVLLFPDVEGEVAFRTAVGLDSGPLTMAPVEERDAPAAWQRATGADGARLVCRGSHVPYPVADASDAMLVALRGETRTVGVMVVADRTAAVGTFNESDLRLLDTMGAHLSVTLENGRLEQSLAQLRALEEQLTHQAFHDSLTALANRALFADRVQHGLARAHRTNGRLAVLFVDLDDFKTINDSLGHAAGDQLLVLVADRLRKVLRPADTAARLGGDEFAILLEDLEADDAAAQVAERVIEALRAPFHVQSNQVQIDTSIGVAIALPGESVDELLSNADVAMYAAKSGGKGRYERFEPAMRAQVLKRHEINAALQLAMERDELTLHYQPIVALDNGAVVGVEALVRWEHPERGLIPPMEFIPLAEETGQIVPMGRWVLRQACTQLRRWCDDGLPGSGDLFMTVNLSPRQLSQPDLLDEVVAALEDTGLDPHRLVLEITESVIMQNTEDTLRVIEGFRRHGVRVAMDDFGTGYSSLSYLQWLPIDIMKIAKPFVDALDEGDERAAVTEAMVTLGHTLHLSIVAEGIETPEQLERLRTLGCDLGQGYHLSRPLTPEALEVWLRQPTPAPAATPAAVASRP